MLTEVVLTVPMPNPLKADLQRLAERDCSTMTATARRLIARGVERELARQSDVTPGDHA